MNAGQTTARDRAIEVVAAKLYAIHGPLSTDEDSAEADGQDVVDALLANPEVLRALAGAPTADVAELAAESAAIANSGTCRCTEDDACWDHEALEMRAEHLLAAAPEGVDAADEQDDDEGHGPWNYTEFGVLCSCGHPVDADERCTRPRGPEAEHQARVGALFEAADNLLTARAQGADIHDYFDDLQDAVNELSTHAAPDGMDLEAQGEMADDVEAVSEAWRVAALAEEQPESVKPHGRDELIEHLAVLWREERRRVARDEQDAKAQGEMADELATAQAAIQRMDRVVAAARAYAALSLPTSTYEMERRADALEEIRAAVRALDGDTTEEKR